jgi:hypothetical protein
MARSIARACLGLTGLFEAELLIELLLRFYEHPLAKDADFRASLLEGAAEALRASVSGQRLFDDLAPANVNFVAALWYAESLALSSSSDPVASEGDGRRKWLETIPRVLPSCFCDPKFLE